MSLPIPQKQASLYPKKQRNISRLRRLSSLAVEQLPLYFTVQGKVFYLDLPKQRGPVTIRLWKNN